MAPYRPMTLADLGVHLATEAAEDDRWLLISEFLEEYRREPAPERLALLRDEPTGTGDEHWDVFLGALAEHLSLQADRAAPAWADERRLHVFWFPLNTPSARVDALVHSPVSFRKRGIFIAPQDLQVA